MGALVALVLAIALVALFALRAPGDAPLRAVVHDGLGGQHVLDLAEDTELVIDNELGRNVVRVQDGAVSIVDADCPNGDCLRQQPLASPGRQLICLPHRLWVEVVPEGQAGGQLDVQAASPENGGDADLIAR